MCGSDTTCGCGCEAKASRASARRERDVAKTKRQNVLDNPTRRAVFGRLVGGPLAVAEIARTLPVSRPAVSQHLKVLKDAGLVEGRTVGRQRVYQATRGREKADPIDVAVGAAIRKAREAAGVSTRDLGHMTGLGDGLIYKLEIGEERLSPVALMKITETLDDLLCPDKSGCVRSLFDRARAQAYAQAQRHGATRRNVDNASLFARSARSARDPSTLVVGGLYYLEWDAHDEGDEGTYVYGGVYPQTGAGMFRRVSRAPRQRVTLYLFPHEIRYLELLERPPAPERPRLQIATEPRMVSGYADVNTTQGAERGEDWETIVVPDGVRSRAIFLGYRMVEGQRRPVWKDGERLYAQTSLPRNVPAPPSSAPRSRRAPELQPGRVLLRPKRDRVWDEGIAGERVARVARFEGFRRIDGEMFGVWSVNDVLYAQPRRS